MNARQTDNLLLPVLTASEMREWERVCFTTGGLSERVVMEAAGRAVAAAIARVFPEGPVVAAVGKGNNGGDALVALRTLRAWGREVLAVPVAGAEPDCRLAHGWELPTAEASAEIPVRGGVFVDGILGTGATGPPREGAASAIEWLNAAGGPVVAIDGPSGVDLTTGRAPGAAVQASLTVTFGCLKRGLLLHPGRRLAGRVVLAEVGFPPVPPAAGRAALITETFARSALPSIPPDAYKGSVGLVAVVAGRPGFGGAVVLTSMGALRAGCGGVRVLSAEANRGPVHAAVPEAVFFAREWENALEALDRTSAAAIGPGIGTDAGALALLRRILEAYPGALALDADAVTLIASTDGLLDAEIARRCVMTPHPGELARLLKTDTEAVLSDRFGAAQAAAERYGCVVLSKGAPSLVASPGQPVLVAAAGHSGVATGGMGDTLTGIVAAFLAAGVAPREAGAAAIHFAGRAAEAAGRGRGLLPRDVAEALPDVLLGQTPELIAEPPFLIEILAAE